MAEQRWCYVAQKDGRPGAAAIVMDVPGEERETAKSVARYIRDGYTVERVPATEGVERFEVFVEYRMRENARLWALAL